jgi:SulP family sulfate permease
VIFVAKGLPTSLWASSAVSRSGVQYRAQSIGGKSRWANIFTGLFATICVLLIAPFIEFIPMPTVAGTLIVVGVQMINVPRMQTVWHTGWIPTAIMIITFVTTLFAPLQVAIGFGGTAVRHYVHLPVGRSRSDQARCPSG